MQSVSWQIEIARLAGGIQVCQGKSDSAQLVSGYPAGVVALIEPPQSSMAKRMKRSGVRPRGPGLLEAAADTTPLVGMLLLERHNLNIEGVALTLWVR